MKKRIVSILLCAVTVFGLAAMTGCAEKDTPASDNTQAASQDAAQNASDNTQTADEEKDDTTSSEVDQAVLAERKQVYADMFLEKANQVTITEDSVTFEDASGEGEKTIMKNPGSVMVLYGSFTTLWYEAGGTASGVIGGDSAVELYEMYIGRDITADEGVEVVADSSSGKKWSVEGMIAANPDLIICSTAMSGYSTISAPATAAGIPVIAISYNDFADYLMWFKVFSAISGHEDLWESIALKSLDEVTTVLAEVANQKGPAVFAMFAGANSLQANTAGTVVGSMINELNAVNIVDSWPNTENADRLDINLETVYAAQPEMILVQCHADGELCSRMIEEQYGSNEVWRSLNAVKENRVFYLESKLFHYKPNSHFAEAYQNLAGILYPNVEFSFQK